MCLRKQNVCLAALAVARGLATCITFDHMLSPLLFLWH